MVLAVGNLVGITGLDIHMIQALLVAASVRIDLVRRGTEIVARTGEYLVRIDGLLLRNSLSRCTALTHTVVAHGSSGRAASGAVARSGTMRAARRSSGGGRRTGCASTVGASCGCTGGGSASRGGAVGASCGCTGGRCASRGGAGGASSVGAGGGSASRGSAMRARAGRGCAGCASAMRTCAGRGSAGCRGAVGAGGRSASRGSAVCARAGRRSSGCAVGSAASAVGGTTGIRIHECVVVSAVRRAGSSVRGSRVPAGAGIASRGRMRRRVGLSRTRHTVGAVARIRGRKSRILDIRTTVRGMAGVACSVGCVACGVRGVAGVTCRVCGVAASVSGVAGVACSVCGVAASVSGVAGVACSVCGVAASVSGVAGATSSVSGVAASVSGVAGTTSSISGVASSVSGVAGATGTVCGMARAAGDATATGSGVCGVAGTTCSIGCPAGCMRGVARVPDSRASPRGSAAGVSGPVQGTSHAVGGVTQVVGVVGGLSHVLRGVCQIREVRGRIDAAGAQLADQVLAELGQGADVVGANRQDRLEDLFADAKSTSSAGQGLLAGGHAGAPTHGRNCNGNVGQEVANGAPGIVGPRIPVDQRLADSRHKAHGIVPQRLPHGRQRLGGYLSMLDVVLFQGHVAHEYAAEVPHALAASQLPHQLHQFDNGLEGAAQDRADRALDRIPPRALGQLRNTSIQCGNQQVAGLIDLIDQRLEISDRGRHGRAARTLITGGIKRGRTAVRCGLAARISLIVLRLLDRVAASLPTRTNPITLALRRRQCRRVRVIGLRRFRERLLGVHPALDLHIELRAEMIRCATFPPISFEGRQAGMNIAELIGAIHHHRGARRNTTRISTDLKNRCTMRNNTHVRSRSRTNDGRLAQRLSSRLNCRHILFSLLHVLAISTQSTTDRTGGSLNLFTQVVGSLFPRVLERVRAIPDFRILQHPRVGNPVLHVVLLGLLLEGRQRFHERGHGLQIDLKITHESQSLTVDARKRFRLGMLTLRQDLVHRLGCRRQQIRQFLAALLHTLERSVARLTRLARPIAHSSLNISGHIGNELLDHGDPLTEGLSHLSGTGLFKDQHRIATHYSNLRHDSDWDSCVSSSYKLPPDESPPDSDPEPAWTND